jgi:hypothetical protein
MKAFNVTAPLNLPFDWPQAEFIILVDRSRCILEYFSAEFLVMESRFYKPLMRAMPDLREFDFCIPE